MNRKIGNIMQPVVSPHSLGSFLMQERILSLGEEIEGNADSII